jgi:rare lipoprotein A
VTNLANGKSTVVIVNDRGPFVKGRLIDLSMGAARRLDIYQRGSAKVLVEALN